VPNAYAWRMEVRSKSCSQVVPSWQISQAPAMVLPSALKVQRRE
jgi:hypothetical protein